MEKLKITVSSAFLPEKRYILDTLFWQFLGIPFSLVPSNKIGPYYKIELPEGNEILFHDNFFSRFDEQAGYLKKEALPDSLVILKNEFCPEPDLPFLFGEDSFQIKEKKHRTELTCGADIFASAFFFLSRWEEHVVKTRDKHKRFPCNESFVQQHGLERRPLVNEYVEFLWNLLKKLSYPGERLSRSYSVIPSHDVDYFRRFDSLWKISKTLMADISNRRSPSLFIKDLKTALKGRKGEINDPFDTFDYLMDESEIQGFTSEFYFISAVNGEYDCEYDINNDEVIDTIHHIISRGHKVGMHASYNVLNKPAVFRNELSRLEKIGGKVQFNRNHYLRFDLPKSWQILADNNFTKSSNMGFSNKAGFRSSCCYSYPVFNILSRRTLQLVEQPLIVMESALVKDKPIQDAFFEEAVDLSRIVKKYNGEFTFLWHNSNLNLPEWESFARRYGGFLEAIK